MIADTAPAPAPPVTPPSPVLLLPMPRPALELASVAPAAKMRSRAALYRAERSAKVPALIGAAEAGELGLELSLASPPSPFF
jgi:hypothetical protein